MSCSASFPALEISDHSLVWLCLRSGGVSIITSQFLRLEPGVQLRPHCGEGNFRWVMHLGLDVPSGVAITVGGKTVAWEEGKVIVFDDSYLHSVEHNGDRDRVVLAMQVRSRPDPPSLMSWGLREWWLAQVMNPEYHAWQDRGEVPAPPPPPAPRKRTRGRRVTEADRGVDGEEF